MKRERGILLQDCEVYIGRQVSKGGWRLTKSLFANPYIVGKTMIAKHSGETIHVLDHQDSIARYWNMIVAGKVDLRSFDEITMMRRALPALRGKVLGCWCKKKGDELCHGDVLRYLADNWGGEVNEKGAMIIDLDLSQMAPGLQKLFTED
jgi:hypothetical protein